MNKQINEIFKWFTKAHNLNSPGVLVSITCTTCQDKLYNFLCAFWIKLWIFTDDLKAVLAADLIFLDCCPLSLW